MSNTKNNGGPAFPVTLSEDHGQPSWHPNGMTLRDYFAAKAMAALIVAIPGGDNGAAQADEYAQGSYEMADAMLKARKQ